MKQILDKIQRTGIIPVVVIEDKKDAVPLADALCKGGLPCAEVTFRTEDAADAIRLMKNAYPEMLIGAGTVLTIAQVDDAIAAGAEITVWKKILGFCRDASVPQRLPLQCEKVCL